MIFQVTHLEPIPDASCVWLQYQGTLTVLDRTYPVALWVWAWGPN